MSLPVTQMVVFNSFKAIRKTQLHNSNCILWHLDPAYLIACRHFIDATAHLYIFTNGTMGDFLSEIREIHLLKIGNKVRGKFSITILKFLSTQLINHFFIYSRLRNKHRGTLINFWTLFQGLRSYQRG